MSFLVKNNLIKFSVAIIGAGPGGLTCAIYASRANLDVCFIDKGAPGGKMTKTFTIENWSGDEEVKGFELSLRMLNHAKKVGAKHIFGNVIKVRKENNHFLIYLEDGKIIQSKALVIATGMNNKIPDIPKIDYYENKGVSYCVICDASLYKGKPAAIIGGGDSAFEEAIYLSSVASEVYIFVRKNKPKAEIGLVKEVENIKNIKVLYQSEIVQLIGEKQLEEIKYKQNGEIKNLKINHLYPYIGSIPSNEFIKDFPIFDENGYILTNENMETSIPGLYAIGDIRQKQIRQIVTAASDGAICGKLLANKIKKH